MAVVDINGVGSQKRYILVGFDDLGGILGVQINAVNDNT